jgi:RNA polymerase sigma factor (sigma-70 family)
MMNMAALTTRVGALILQQRRCPQSLTDGELVEKFQHKRDVDVFEILVQRYRDKVFAMATSILGRSAGSEAEDATQEVFIAVYHNLDTFRGDAAFSSWLYRVARNQIYGYRRRPAHRVVSGSEDDITTLRDTDVHADPLAILTSGSVRRTLLEVVDQLSELQKICVHLFYWQDQTIIEIASLLDIEANTVKSHLRRARVKMAKILRERDVDY